MKNMSSIIDYRNLLSDIKKRIKSAQYEALRQVNKELISLYWDIGKTITDQQKGKTWGKSIVEKLSKDLQNEFPGIKGFSFRNIWYMRIFYDNYKENKKLQQLVAEISWGHNIVIIEKCKDDFEKEFYIRMSRKFGWSRSVLIHKIEKHTYEKTLLNQTNFDKTVSEEIRNQAKLSVKDEYTFDFLELGDEYNEKQLEKSVLLKIDKFLKEMGGMFAFIGNQYWLEIGNNEYFIDLLLYHRDLKCLIAIELKIGDFIPEHIGKMQFYLAVLDDKVRLEGENPSIGIILCKNKNEIIVEYALKESKKPIGIANYNIVSTLPAELQGKLPTPEQIDSLLGEIK